MRGQSAVFDHNDVPHGGDKRLAHYEVVANVSPSRGTAIGGERFPHYSGLYGGPRRGLQNLRVEVPICTRDARPPVAGKVLHDQINQALVLVGVADARCQVEAVEN